MTSTTLSIPQTGEVPQHVAIIMDGNGRWATQKFLPRVAGHKKGVDAVKVIVEACAQRGVKYLTLFAFSSENWRRPQDEVSLLMRLFVHALDKQVAKLHKNQIKLKVVGDLSRFDPYLRELIQKAETLTQNNQRLVLTIAANYGGRWDILQATQRMLVAHPEYAQQPDQITESQFIPYLSMAYAPEPDLFIRTGGEQRISNFLIWQLAYTELYFSDKYWPDFNAQSLDEAFASYRHRERRFGRTSAQLPSTNTLSP